MSCSIGIGIVFNTALHKQTAPKASGSVCTSSLHCWYPPGPTLAKCFRDLMRLILPCFVQGRCVAICIFKPLQILQTPQNFLISSFRFFT